MIINPDGLFNGDRLGRCSNLAHLHWPFLFLASNGYGRLELNYHRLVVRAFARFSPPPSQQEFWSYIQEYRDYGLLFVWEADGKVWGQWDTDPKYLPRFKTAEDRKSPFPQEVNFNEWVKAARGGLLVKTKDFRKFPSGVGVGVGVGIGVEAVVKLRSSTVLYSAESKTETCPSAKNATWAFENLPFDTLDATEPAVKLAGINGSSPTPRVRLRTPRKANTGDADFDGWYAEYFRRVAREDGLKAYRKLRDEFTPEKILEGTRRWKPFYQHKEPEHRPYPATFLNRRQFLEEPPADECRSTAEQRFLERHRNGSR